ncbi:hypothetical protein HQ531_09115 [bacterium]|nr:hypothetical protein [bacterium]
MKRTVLITLLSLLLFGNIAYSQDGLAGSLEQMLQTNAEMYLQPFGEAFGANMNSALYHRSRVHKMLGFDLGVKTMWAVIPEESKTFEWDLLPENKITFDVSSITSAYDIGDLELGFDQIYDPNQTTTSTMFGDTLGGSLVVDDAGLTTLFTNHIHSELVADGLTSAQADLAVASLSPDIANFVGGLDDLPLPGGLDLEEGTPMPLIMPQASIGLPMGIELMIRGIPSFELPENMGEFNLFGGGVRINIDQFIPIPLFPVDITAGVAVQQMNIGDLVSASNTSINMQVGKSLSLLMFGIGIYADVAYDASTLSIAYDADFLPDDPDNDLTHIEFELDSDPGMRFGGGLHITAVPLTYISLGYSTTPTNDVLTLGAGITFR